MGLYPLIGLNSLQSKYGLGTPTSQTKYLLLFLWPTYKKNLLTVREIFLLSKKWGVQADIGAGIFLL